MHAAGFTLDDYDTEIVEIWPENQTATELFSRVGTRWKIPPMGGTPYGLEWTAIYPMMDRLQLAADEWQELHDDLMVMESEAIRVMRKFSKDK